MTLVDVSGNTLAEYQTADKLAFDTRPLPTRDFVLPLPLPAQTTISLIIKVRHSGTLYLPLTLRDHEHFWQYERRAGKLDGALFGIMLVMLFYNGITWWLTGERGYGYCTAYIGVFTLTRALHGG